jgi:transglutaminase-like putative cysteine protease
MRLRIGCQFGYDSLGPCPSVWQVRPRPDGDHGMVSETWESPVPSRVYLDAFGNLCDRLTLPEGQSTVRYDALVEVPSSPDDADEDAPQRPIEELPDEVLVYLLPSRFCFSDVLADEAWSLFGDSPPGFRRVQAVSDWVHQNVRYQVGASNPQTTALDIWESRQGVCRDLTHLGITLCRAINIPARYVAGYLPDIGVAPPDLPMDFCSWLEVWLGDRWWTFDPRNNQRRLGRVVIARGRDALDVAMVTTYGTPALKTMTVWADEAPEAQSGGDG